MTPIEANLLWAGLVFAAGFGFGLWVGFKLWRETYVRGIPRRGPGRPP